LTDSVRAYVNHGRWVADCCREFCNNAMKLKARQSGFHCANCGLDAVIEWPADADEIWRALERRPVPQTRNWFPSEHLLAVRAGVEHGQTVADLLAENEEHGVKGMR
jgi:hypothetical protein